VSPNFKIGENGFSTSIYGFEFEYPYSEKLYIFNYEKKQILQITDRNKAMYYFNNISKSYKSRCPTGYPGYGVKNFKLYGFY